MNQKGIALMVSTVAFLMTLGFFTSQAQAGIHQDSCTVTGVLYDEGRLALTCSGSTSWYYGFTAHAYCPTQKLDTIKIWVSMLQEALIHGRPVVLVYEKSWTCYDTGLIQITMR